MLQECLLAARHLSRCSNVRCNVQQYCCSLQPFVGPGSGTCPHKHPDMQLSLHYGSSRLREPVVGWTGKNSGLDRAGKYRAALSGISHARNKVCSHTVIFLVRPET